MHSPKTKTKVFFFGTQKEKSVKGKKKMTFIFSNECDVLRAPSGSGFQHRDNHERTIKPHEYVKTATV